MIAEFRPISEWPKPARAKIVGVFADIDDTITTDGRVGAAAYAAMERLRGAGLLFVPITGRPAGWCDMIARTWPVDGVVGENGAFYFSYDQSARRMRRAYAMDVETRRRNRVRLDTLQTKILNAVPGAGIAADQHYREADLAIDFCEDVPPLSDRDIDRIVEIFEQNGATAKVSSIHVNGWFGDYDKLTMTAQMMRALFDVDLDAQRDRYVFIGDSPNDAPMFDFFPDAVGVANLRAFQDRCRALPRWITTAPGGTGFVEMTECLLKTNTG